MDIFSHICSIFKDIDDPVVFEIGAHHAEDTLTILTCAGFPEKIVDAFIFEPDPRNIDEVKRVTEGLVGVKRFNSAIGNYCGYSEFHLSSGNANGGEDWTGSSSLQKPKNHLNAHPWCKFDQVAKVAVTTLDFAFLSYGLSKIDFIWADIQGAEAAMVQGGQLALKHTKYLYCEYSDHELYEGQLRLEDWFKLLPGKWEIMEKYTHDVLLENKEWQSLSK